jgi:hypothetical protein
LLGFNLIFIFMKNLELTQMEHLSGGRVDYGDMTCGEFWAVASAAVTLASPYVTVALPGWGLGVSIVLGLATTAGSLTC